MCYPMQNNIGCIHFVVVSLQHSLQRRGRALSMRDTNSFVFLPLSPGVLIQKYLHMASTLATASWFWPWPLPRTQRVLALTSVSDSRVLALTSASKSSGLDLCLGLKEFWPRPLPQRVLALTSVLDSRVLASNSASDSKSSGLDLCLGLKSSGLDLCFGFKEFWPRPLPWPHSSGIGLNFLALFNIIAYSRHWTSVHGVSNHYVKLLTTKWQTDFPRAVGTEGEWELGGEVPEPSSCSRWKESRLSTRAIRDHRSAYVQPDTTAAVSQFKYFCMCSAARRKCSDRLYTTLSNTSPVNMQPNIKSSMDDLIRMIRLHGRNTGLNPNLHSNSQVTTRIWILSHR